MAKSVANILLQILVLSFALAGEKDIFGSWKYKCRVYVGIDDLEEGIYTTSVALRVPKLKTVLYIC